MWVVTFLSEFGSLNRIIVTEHIGATKQNYAACRTQQSELVILLHINKSFHKLLQHIYIHTQEKLILQCTELMLIHTHTHIYIYTHTHTHIYTHTHTHTHIYVYMPSQSVTQSGVPTLTIFQFIFLHTHAHTQSALPTPSSSHAPSPKYLHKVKPL